MKTPLFALRVFAAAALHLAGRGGSPLTQIVIGRQFRRIYLKIVRFADFFYRKPVIFAGGGFEGVTQGTAGRAIVWLRR